MDTLLELVHKTIFMGGGESGEWVHKYVLGGYVVEFGPLFGKKNAFKKGIPL